MPVPVASVAASAKADENDAVVLVVRDLASVASQYPGVAAAAAVDAKFASRVSVVPEAGVAGGRVIVSCTGPLTRDFGEQ